MSWAKKSRRASVADFAVFPAVPVSFSLSPNRKPSRVTCNGVVLKFMQLGFRLDITSPNPDRGILRRKVTSGVFSEASPRGVFRIMLGEQRELIKNSRRASHTRAVA